VLKNNAAAGEAGSALRERSRRCGDTRSRWNSVRCAGLEEGPEEGRLDRGRVKPAEGCWVLWTWDRGVDNAYESGFDRLGKVPRPGEIDRGGKDVDEAGRRGLSASILEVVRLMHNYCSIVGEQ